MKKLFAVVMIRSTVLVSTFVLALASTFVANAGGTGVDAGGGTAVQANASKALMLWDLFANFPIYTEPKSGEQVPLPKAEISRLDYQSLESFDLLKKRASEIQHTHPNLYNLIASESFFKVNTWSVFTTADHIRDLAELFYKYDSYAGRVLASPVAYFDEPTEFIYINAELWNQMGLTSQAGLLLHERLRHLQQKHDLSNELVQSIVAFVIDPKIAWMQGRTVDDQYFAYFNIAAASSPVGVSAKVSKAGSDHRYSNDLTELKGQTDSEALLRFQELKAAGLFQSQPNTFENPKTLGFRNSRKTLASEVILDSKNCNRLVSGLESIINTYRPNLFCSGDGSMNGTGELFFKTPMTGNTLAIDFVMNLYTGNDGGSEVELNFFNTKELEGGFKIQLANHGSFYQRVSLKEATEKIPPEVARELVDRKPRKYRAVIDRSASSFSVFAQTSKGLVLINTALIKGEVNLKNETLFWSYSINNNTTLHQLEVSQ